MTQFFFIILSILSRHLVYYFIEAESKIVTITIIDVITTITATIKKSTSTSKVIGF